jgi:LPXTG-motif cell wall-anchored protein
MSLTNFDDDQFDQDIYPEEAPPELEKKPGNKTFIILISVLGGIFVIALVALLLFGQKFLTAQRQQHQEQAALINAANTATAMAATLAAQPTATQVPPTPEPQMPTNTPVVVIASSTPQPQGTSGLTESELATVSALQTQMAGQTATATALPNTGFADEFGLPVMAGMAVILVAIILLSRKLRLSSR